jgi:hypothetical protein
MITQAIKRWLRKMFAWWPWKSSTETSYADIASPLNKGTTSASTPWSTIEGTAPQPGTSPLAPRRSSIEGWPERTVQPHPPAVDEPPETLLPAHSATPPAETVKDSLTSIKEASSSPVPEKHLEFLYYLVKHGIVNEGFEEGQVPEQYRK